MQRKLWGIINVDSDAIGQPLITHRPHLPPVTAHWLLISVRGGVNPRARGFGGLMVRVLASGTQDSRFKPGRSRRNFWVKKFLTRLPSEEK
jgi:hypothetical protein